MHAFILDAQLVGFPGVRRTIAIRADQKLTHLHHALQDAFGWGDDHLYSFWLSERFWDRRAKEYTIPFELKPHRRSAAVRLSKLKLKRGQGLAYVFDFGDEWRVSLRVRSIEAAEGADYPRIIETVGEAPPQYPDYEGGDVLAEAV